MIKRSNDQLGQSKHCLLDFNVNTTTSQQKLYEVIQSLLSKVKNLISLLEDSSYKISDLEDKCKFWQNRYYSFKSSCIDYSNLNTIKYIQRIADLQNEVKRLSMTLYCTKSFDESTKYPIKQSPYINKHHKQQAQTAVKQKHEKYVHDKTINIRQPRISDDFKFIRNINKQKTKNNSLNQ